MATTDVRVIFKNSFNHAVVSKVSLTYQHNNDVPLCKNWEELQLRPGESTTSFDIGSISDEGKDVWDVVAEVNVSNNTIASFSNKTRQLSVPLHYNDAGKDIIVEISEEKFKMVKSSGDKTDGLKITVNSNPTRPEPITYYHIAYVTLQNLFPISVDVSLFHQYGNDTIIKKEYRCLAPGAVSEPWPVFYNYSMLKSDYWNVEVAILTLNDYHPTPLWKNSTVDMKASLDPTDSGKMVECSIDGLNGLKMQFAKSKVVSELRTPLSSNRMTAFGAIKNNFKVSIRKVILKHSYGDKYKACHVRYDIQPGTQSDPFFIEYSTGRTTPYHYWNVTVELKDGSLYSNCDKDKRLYFQSADANVIHVFGVSDSTFLVRLNSENSTFDTGMVFIGILPPNQGRDLSLSYEKNAFIVSHHSYENITNGFTNKVASQSYSLHGQLAQGATCLELEIEDSVDDVVVYKKAPQKMLAHELCYVKDYMKKNQNEVVTLFLKDNVKQHRDKIQTAFESAGLWEQVFFCDREMAGWSVSRQGWPSLLWMIRNRKRVVVFSTYKEDNLFPYIWSHIAESIYGDDSLNPEKWAGKRYESSEFKSCTLLFLNHYSTWPSAGKNNNNISIQKHVNDIQRHYEKLPNFICLSFFDQPQDGPSIAIVALNKKLQQHR